MQTIAIIGAGFSGALLTTHLLRRPGVRVVLIERSESMGLGLAYSTTCPAHLLNVRTGRMSAFPDDPGHFARWLSENRPEFADPESFAPRMVFGDYVRAILAEAVAAAAGRLERLSGDAVDVRPDGSGLEIVLADRRRVRADRVVLALGNGAPTTPDATLASAGGERYIADPWAPGALETIQAGDDVLLLGAGLTMIDVALALQARGWTGRALALSRRGLLPRPHDAEQAPVTPEPPIEGPLSQRLKAFRRRAEVRGWGAAMDEIRPFNQATWRTLDDKERGRFLRHLRPWWDVHRHRVATGVADRLDELFSAGQVRATGGRVTRVERGSAGLLVDWRPRGEAAVVHDRFDRVVNCTGPIADLSRSPEPLIRALLASGLVRTDSLKVGIEVDDRGRVIGRNGVDARLWAIGPMTKSEAWETIAVPEIRGQAAALADRLTHA